MTSIQIRIDSFAAAISEPAIGLALNPAERMHHLLKEVEFGDRVGLDVFGISELLVLKQLKQEAMYPVYAVDANGQKLDGAQDRTRQQSPVLVSVSASRTMYCDPLPPEADC